MSDNIQILISALLDPATKLRLQKEINQMSAQAAKSVKSSSATENSKKIASDSELFIKMSKVREAQEARLRRSETIQENARMSATKEQMKLDQKRFMMLEKINKLQATKPAVFKSAEVSQLLPGVKSAIGGMKTTDPASITKATQAMAQYDTQVSKTTKSFANANAAGKSFGQMIMANAVKVSQWLLSTTLIYAPLRALQAGLQTLKELDTLMVDIAKVTNLTANEMKNLVARSFDAAGALGQTAQSYLSAVAEFSRAGYEGQAEGLASLALLSQNVGELTSEQATQFLLATDAAYKYKGSQEGLMKVLDGVNEIDNKFATSIEKVSDGITVAGSIASSAGVGVDELSAAIGTMTAITQKSGNEAGRAFRGILMNIRQIKGETEDGEIIDDAALSKSAKALDAVGIKVHEMRNGIEELRNPMDVLKDLAKTWDSLTTMQQSPIIEALGGKYRGNEHLLTAPYVQKCA